MSTAVLNVATFVGYAPRDSDWLEAEMKFPGCSAAWDRDGGHEWAGSSPNLTICVGTSLAIGCNDQPPYRWALWLEKQESWLFVVVGKETSP